MNKGINTAIEETKAELINLINSKLAMGVPVSVMGVLIDNISYQIKPHVINAVKMESENIQNKEISDSETEA